MENTHSAGASALALLPRHVRRNASLWLWLLNVVLGYAIGRSYLDGLFLETSTRLWIFAHVGLLSSVATLSLAPLAFTWLLARVRVRDRVFVALQSLAWMALQVALVIDTRVYGLFRYHFNGAAWNLITTSGSEDSYRLGPKIWIVGFALGATFFSLEWFAWRALTALRRNEGRKRVLVPAWIGAVLVALAVCVEKGIYAKADLDSDRSVAAVSQAFPMYPRVSVMPMLSDPLRQEMNPLPEIVVTDERAALAYPRALPSIDPRGPRPNILVLVVDSWRRDMLREDVTPNLWRFARDARRFDDHLSGGNGTRFGVFALIYGLHGSYWWPVLEAQRSPVMLDALAELGYDIEVFSSASMDYPEFRRTAWARLEGRVHDEFGEERPSIRDARAAELCARWWSERDAAQPFFGFVLLDSAHQKYDFPEDDAPFVPYARDVDYLELAGSRDPELVARVRNRYLNGLHHADTIAGRLLDELERLGLARDTLVIVTGDHGEEFTENGYWGHTGNFTAEQVAVPFVMRGPGIAPGVELRPTAHVDLPATVLELLGADPAQRANWCTSENLLAPPSTRARVVAGWEEIGLWTASGIFRVPRVAQFGGGANVCDAKWRLVVDQRAAFAAETTSLEQLSAECARFLDPAARAAR